MNFTASGNRQRISSIDPPFRVAINYPASVIYTEEPGASIDVKCEFVLNANEIMLHFDTLEREHPTLSTEQRSTILERLRSALAFVGMKVSVRFPDHIISTDGTRWEYN